MVQELHLRNIAADVKLSMRKLIGIVEENEHPQWKERQNSMSDEEIYDVKFFSPRYLSADEWDKDNISASNK